MRGVTNFVRRAMLAALLFSPAAGWAEVRATLDATNRFIDISGLTSVQRDHLIANTGSIFLQNSAVGGTKGMALSTREAEGALVIEPKYPLLSGADYDLRLAPENGDQFETLISVASADAARPELLWRAPDAEVIPANTLRLYLMFSEPMAKGQVRNAIWLERADGTIVDSPFLNLGAELWDREQRRLTLFFDPGRLKQGVGPNQSDGAPLVEGGSYELIISGEMKSAEGLNLHSEIRNPLLIGPAERDIIDTSQWKLNAPSIGTRQPLSVQFQRLMDRASAIGRIAVLDATGAPLAGAIQNHGAEWLFTPQQRWSGSEQLIVDPRLEDVAGNTPRAPFDAVSGTIGTFAKTIRIAIY